MRRLVIGPHRDAQAAPPGAIGKALDFLFAAEIDVLELIGLELEAFEIAEMVEDEPGNQQPSIIRVYSGSQQESGVARLVKAGFIPPAAEIAGPGQMHA
jgi:hypothetical protein